MNNKIKTAIILTIVFFVSALLIFALSKVKVDEFHKASVIFLVDSSASNATELPEQLKTLKQLCSMLDPEDSIKILRVSQDAYLIYEGSPQSLSEIRKSLDEFTKLDNKEYGTAYGLALKKAFKHSLNMYNEGYIPSVVVIGDLENEGKSEKQIDWKALPDEVKEIKGKTQNFTMMFLYANPEKLDFVKENLSGVLGENNLIIAPKTNTDKSLRRFLSAIGR